MALVVELLLVGHPNDIGLHHDRVLPAGTDINENGRISGEKTPLLGLKTQNEAIQESSLDSWWDITIAVLNIPGLISYSWAIFFCKLVVYSFLYWLPYYIHHTGKRHQPVKA